MEKNEVIVLVEETPVFPLKTKLALVAFLRKGTLPDAELVKLADEIRKANDVYAKRMAETEPQRREALLAYKAELERIVHEVIPKEMRAKEDQERASEEQEEEKLLQQL